MKFCPECGAPVSETNKFCPNCGSKLDRGDGPSIHTIPTAPSAPAAAPSTDDTGSPSLTPPPPAVDAPRAPVKDTSGLPPAWMPPPVQPGTGTTIVPGASRASSGEEKGEHDAPIPPPPTFMPPPVKTTFGDTTSNRAGGLSSVSDEFKMSDLGPPPPPKRRLWLWIPLGVIGFVILCCITFVVLSETVLEDTFDRWATEIATDSTEEAVGP